MSNIAILTNFQDLHPGYSLSGIVHDQAIMLDRFGHKVYFYTCETYNDEYDIDMPAEPVRKIPFVNLIDYQTEKDFTPEHEKYSDKLKEVLIAEFRQKNIEFAFSHDWIFTGWNLPYSLAIRKANPHLIKTSWLHWVHSVPADVRFPHGRDWWDIRRYGPNHKIVFPNSTERTRVAEQFKGHIQDIRIIPHIKDLRTLFDFDPETWRFIDDFPGMMQADIVQVYPASTDRLHAKQVQHVMGIFGAMKQRGFSVFLAIANQWYGRPHEQKISDYHEIAKHFGLRKDEDYVFTSEWDKQYGVGIPKRILKEMYLCSNIFIYPTVEESFGLVGPEAALAGNFMVINKSLSMMFEVFGNTGLYLDFGSHHNIFNPANVGTGMSWDTYLDNVATVIIGRLAENEAYQSRTWCRKVYNMDNLYLHRYEPIMGESKTWGKGIKEA